MPRSLFSRVEGLVDPTLTPASPPPASSNLTGQGVWAFYWHFLNQFRGLFFAMLGLSLALALVDTLIPFFIGKLVSLMTLAQPQQALAQQWPTLLGMVAVILLVRPAVLLVEGLVRNNAVLPGVTSAIRWQSHWHIIRQGWAFFQNDFAGRIANRVMQTPNSLRESVTGAIRSVWYIIIYGVVTLVFLVLADWRLAIPTLVWVIAYLFFLRYFVPRLRRLAQTSSEVRSLVVGRIVDSYTNILTVKLFSRADAEDAWVKDVLEQHVGAVQGHMRMITLFNLTLTLMNAMLLIATAGLGLWLWSQGRVPVGIVATAVPLAWQISNTAGWVSWEVAGIFENIGTVQEGMETIATEPTALDRIGASDLIVAKGEIRLEHLNYRYPGNDRPVLQDVDLTIAPGERIGVVGRSGAGKSTLVNLLLRFFELTTASNDKGSVNSGRILIDGQDIAQVTQESLRAAIGMVTQDTSLLHRSIAQNIAYGRPSASTEEIHEAARRAQALEFIESLQDWKGRRGFDAHVGERGVKLSGGQRQRIALARVLLKASPILILDEATSALDSEVERAIQTQLDELMQGRTVIAIAHRLSTIARLDRLVVLDAGRIVEQGTHEQLLAHEGLYAELWRHQSGGFL